MYQYYTRLWQRGSTPWSYDIDQYINVLFIHMFPLRMFDEWARSTLKHQYDIPSWCIWHEDVYGMIQWYVVYKVWKWNWNRCGGTELYYCQNHSFTISVMISVMVTRFYTFYSYSHAFHTTHTFRMSR